MGMTNKGKLKLLELLQNGGMPTLVYCALLTDDLGTQPTAGTNTFSELTEIALGNGYDVAGGTAFTPDATFFDVVTQDDPNNRAFVQLTNIVYSAGAGPIPMSGAGARWMVLLDDEGGSAGTRNVWAYWNLGQNRTILAGQTLTVQNSQINANEP